MEPPQVQEVTKTIMAIRIEAFKDVIARGNYTHAQHMLTIILSDVCRGALDTWLVNKSYFCAIIEEIMEYCVEKDNDKILTCLEVLEGFVLEE